MAFKCITLDNQEQVVEKLNQWDKYGWKVPEKIAGMVKNADGSTTIYYDEKLDINTEY